MLILAFTALVVQALFLDGAGQGRHAVGPHLASVADEHDAEGHQDPAEAGDAAVRGVAHGEHERGERQDQDEAENGADQEHGQ